MRHRREQVPACPQPAQSRRAGRHRDRRADSRFSNRALLDIIRRYTKESGVRDLERQIARI